MMGSERAGKARPGIVWALSAEGKPIAKMAARERRAAAEPNPVPYDRILGVYLRALSVAMLLLGLRQWAVILGVLATGGGPFESMPAEWEIATMHLAVADLVAAVGLWMRVSWGNVLWIYAAVAEIALHTIFMRTFGSDVMVIAFHLLTMAAFLFLSIMARRAASA